MFYHVEMYQKKSFISNCWQNKISKLNQIFWCQIFWCQIVCVPNCLFLNSWCQIVRVPNCLHLILVAKLSYNPNMPLEYILGNIHYIFLILSSFPLAQTLKRVFNREIESKILHIPKYMYIASKMPIGTICQLIYCSLYLQQGYK